MIEDGKRSSVPGPSPNRGAGRRGSRVGFELEREEGFAVVAAGHGDDFKHGVAPSPPSGPLGGGPELVEGRRKGGSADLLLSPRARRVTDAGREGSRLVKTIIGGRRAACPGGPRQSNRAFNCEGPQRPQARRGFVW